MELKRVLNAFASAALARVGHSPAMAADAKREAWWWLQARGSALRRHSGLFRGRAIVWADVGRAELVPIEVPRPGAGEITIRVLATAVSSGTERAQYLQLPSARTGFPFRPGYSAAGVVLACGRGVTSLHPGQLVAARGVPHSSVATLHAADIFVVPEGVDPFSAATLALGIICGQGVRLAAIPANERFCILGAGPIGLLAQRLAQAGGAGAGTVVARSRRQMEAAHRGGATFVALEDEPLPHGYPVVIEATGDPRAFADALDVAGVGGRVVLLGSSRGEARARLAQVREKRLTVVGAHVETLAYAARRTGHDTVRAAGQTYLAALAAGAVHVADLIEEAVDPREADAFYQRLSQGSVTAAVFDWSFLPDADAVSPSPVLRIPDLRARGLDRDRSLVMLDLAEPAEATLHGHPTQVSRRSDSRLRIGLLGCGDIAVHNAAAVDAAPNASLVACFDPVASLAEDIARTHGATVTLDAEALVTRRDVDAVLLSVPHHLHEPLALLAIEAGKHVIVEKPLANNLAAACAIASAAKRAGVVLSTCFPHRYETKISIAKRLIDAGALGSLAGARLSLLSEKPEAYWYGGFSGRASSDWRSSREKAGGGFLIMNLSHYVDLLLHLVAQPVEACVAAAHSARGQAEVEDAISVTLRFGGQAVATIVGSSAAPGFRVPDSEFELWGEDGFLRLEPEPRLYTRRALAGVKPSRWHALAAPPPRENIRTTYVRRFADAVAHGIQPDVSASDALLVQAVIEAAYLSIDAGGVIRPAELLEGAAV